jgi:hypothetical protein
LQPRNPAAMPVFIEPGDLGLSEGRDLASYDLRSNSLRFFFSTASGAPPLEKTGIAPGLRGLMNLAREGMPAVRIATSV